MMSLTIKTSSMPVSPFSLPIDYEFTFVGEGAANVVFEVLANSDDESSSSTFDGEIRSIPQYQADN